MPDPVQPREGDIAFALSVNTLYDLTIGRVAWPVRFTRHSSPDKYTLTLANRTPGGPILNILGVNPDGSLDESHSLFSVWEDGVQSQQVGGYIDFAYQPAGAPPAPGAGTDLLRMYSRGGHLFFKAEGSEELEIPVGSRPGPVMRWTYWMSGG